MKQETRGCQNCKNQFTIAPDDFVFYKKIDVPAPTWCPQCRMVRRFSFRNVRTIYKRKDIAPGKEIISGFAPEKQITLYEDEYWRSDAWDAMQYGRAYDFSQPFFAQFKELLYTVPWPCAYRAHSINSDYCNNVDGLQNCFLMFNSGFSEDCYYGTEVLRSKNCVDCTNVIESELCYELIDCENCFSCMFSQDCVKCTDVAFSYNLSDCQYCFGCSNLKHKQYYIFNKSYSEEEYFDEMKKFQTSSYCHIQIAKEFAEKCRSSMPVKFMHGYGNENVTGDYLQNCRNVKRSFLCKDLENCAYAQLILFMPSHDSYDFAVAGGELCYEVEEGGGYNVRFCWLVLPKNLKEGSINLVNLEYCVYCMNSSDLFGCVGLRNKQYCIFNTQYTKEEFYELRARIIQQMNQLPYVDKRGIQYRYGEFFPSELSPFSYNETLSHEFFPLTKEQARAAGYSWREQEDRTYTIMKDVAGLPDMIANVIDSVTGEVLACAHKSECTHNCTKAFKITTQELGFYRKMGIALPRMCHNCRHGERVGKRNRLELRHRQCMCDRSGHSWHPPVGGQANRCNNEFETSYAPGRKEIVYCEQCYQAEVV